jgi:hypothetical protein
MSGLNLYLMMAALCALLLLAGTGPMLIERLRLGSKGRKMRSQLSEEIHDGSSPGNIDQ